VETK